jgi:uncharacterized protein (DUF1015 family)
MPRISSFVGLVFDPAVVGPLASVTAPPYDVIGEAAERGFLRASPYNVVRLDLGERDGSGGPTYGRAAELLDAWRREGALVPTSEGWFAYEMRDPAGGRERSIRGLVGAMELQDWGDEVMPHERTMAGPVEDRLRQLRATRANLSMIYGTVAGPCRGLEDALGSVVADPPGWSALDEEGVEHRMWALDLAPELQEQLSTEPVMIADGHHRYATALAFREERRAAEGPGPWDRVMTLLVDEGTASLPVQPFHRMLLRGRVPADGARVATLEELLAGLSDDELRYGIATVEDGSLVLRLAELPGPPPVVSALHRHVLGPDDPSGEELRFTADPAVAIASVVEGRAVASYLLPPTTPERIRDVVARGERLPQKSTFFWPKPRTGMIIRPLDRPRG